MLLTECRQKNIPIGGEILKEKALFFAKALNVYDFKASSGWLDRFKNRHNIAFKKLCGERSVVNQQMCLEWKEKLFDLIKDYEAKDIYNADEKGLFYKCLPDRTYCFRNEKCHGGKHSKERITLLFAVMSLYRKHLQQSVNKFNCSKI